MPEIVSLLNLNIRYFLNIKFPNTRSISNYNPQNWVVSKLIEFNLSHMEILHQGSTASVINVQKSLSPIN